MIKFKHDKTCICLLSVFHFLQDWGITLTVEQQQTLREHQWSWIQQQQKKLLFYSTITAFKQCKDSILFSNPRRTASITGSVPELQSEPPDSCHNLSQAYLGNRMSTATSQKSIDNIIMIGMMRIRKMKTRVCQTGKLQCTLPEVSLKQHVSCYIIQIFATWAISGHEPMLYILFRQH